MTKAMFGEIYGIPIKVVLEDGTIIGYELDADKSGEELEKNEQNVHINKCREAFSFNSDCRELRDNEELIEELAKIAMKC